MNKKIIVLFIATIVLVILILLIIFLGNINYKPNETNNIEGNIANDRNINSLVVGDIVQYIPNGYYIAENQYTGYEKNQILNSQNDDFKITEWYVYEIDKENVTLISKNATNGTLYLNGYNGYNNAVKILNEACKSLYSDTQKGITARSINITDIENHINKEFIKEFNEEFDDDDYHAYDIEHSYYPNIYINEKKSVIDNRENFNGLRNSEQTDFIFGYTQGKELKPYNTAREGYDIDNPLFDQINKKIIIGDQTNNFDLQDVWIASRSCTCNIYDGCYFQIYKLEVPVGDSNASVWSDTLFRSDNSSDEANNTIRPIIETSFSHFTKLENGKWKIN